MHAITTLRTDAGHQIGFPLNMAHKARALVIIRPNLLTIEVYCGPCEYIQAFSGLPDVVCDKRFVVDGRIEWWVYELERTRMGLRTSVESEYTDVDALIVIEIEIYAHEIQIRFPIEVTQKRPELNEIKTSTRNQKQPKRTIDFPLGMSIDIRRLDFIYKRSSVETFKLRLWCSHWLI